MRQTVFPIPVLAAVILLSCSKDPIDISLPDTDATIVETDDSAGGDIETDKDDDNVANSTFDRTVKVIFNGNDASVTGVSDDFAVSVDGAGVTITNKGEEAVIYELTGSSSNGYFKLYSTRKQELLLNGLSLTNKTGAAINNQSHKRTFVVVRGTNNLADGASYTATPSDEDEKAAFFSEGQLVFSGNGTLTVNATGKAGITSDDYVRFMDAPVIKVTSSAGHGVRGKEAIIVSDGVIDVEVSGTGKKGFSSDTLVYFGGGVTTIKTTGSAGDVDGELTGVAGIKADLRFEMEGGTLDITSTGTGAKGISGDNVAYFKGGTITVNVTGANYGSSSSSGGSGPGGWGGRPGQGDSSSSDNSVASKAIKFDGNMYVSGGKIVAKSSKHEAIEAKGVLQVTGGEMYAVSSDDAVNTGGDMTVEGGAVFAQSTGNDGLDANGDLYIKGGVVYTLGSGGAELAVDANSEAQKKLYLTGGVVIAVGGLENGASLSQACWSAGTVKSDTRYALYDKKGEVLCAFKTPSTGSNLTLVLSAPDLDSVKYGVTVEGGESLFEGLYTTGAAVSGGNGCTLSTYTGGQGGPGGGRPGW